MTEAEIWRGAGACMAGDKCPENASEGFQRGYGLAYAAGENEMDQKAVIAEYLNKGKQI